MTSIYSLVTHPETFVRRMRDFIKLQLKGSNSKLTNMNAFSKQTSTDSLLPMVKRGREKTQSREAGLSLNSEAGKKQLVSVG